MEVRDFLIIDRATNEIKVLLIRDLLREMDLNKIILNDTFLFEKNVSSNVIYDLPFRKLQLFYSSAYDHLYLEYTQRNNIIDDFKIRLTINAEDIPPLLYNSLHRLAWK